MVRDKRTGSFSPNIASFCHGRSSALMEMRTSTTWRVWKATGLTLLDGSTRFYSPWIDYQGKVNVFLFLVHQRFILLMHILIFQLCFLGQYNFTCFICLLFLVWRSYVIVRAFWKIGYFFKIVICNLFQSSSSSAILVPFCFRTNLRCFSSLGNHYF